MSTVIEQRIGGLQDWALQRPYLGALVRAASKSHADRSKDMAASIAYFTFLSLFPLILGLVSLGGYFLESEDIQLRVNQLIVELLPASAEFVTHITDSLVRIRGAAGVTSVLILIWSASKMVGAMSRAINMALGQKRNYAIYLSSLRNFFLTLIVAMLVVATLAISPVLELLAELQLEFIGERWNSVIRLTAGRTAGLFVTLLLVGFAYALIPHHRIAFTSLLPGMLTATLLLEVGKFLFVWYVETASNYSAVYGSVSSIIVLLIWLYFAARVLLFGAEIISVNLEDQ